MSLTRNLASNASVAVGKVILLISSLFTFDQCCIKFRAITNILQCHGHQENIYKYFKQIVPVIMHHLWIPDRTNALTEGSAQIVGIAASYYEVANSNPGFEIE